MTQNNVEGWVYRFEDIMLREFPKAEWDIGLLRRYKKIIIPFSDIDYQREWIEPMFNWEHLHIQSEESFMVSWCFFS